MFTVHFKVNSEARYLEAPALWRPTAAADKAPVLELGNEQVVESGGRC